MRSRYFFISLFAVGFIVLVGMGFLYINYRNNRIAEMERINAAKAEDVKVTTIEGWTIKDIADKLGESGMFSSDQFLTAIKTFDTEPYAFIKKPSGTSLEGYLFADTYRFAKNSKPDDVIMKMLQDFQMRLYSIGISMPIKDNYTIPGYENLNPVGGDNKQGLSLYDILTLASIVEKESGGKGLSEADLNDQRATIAGIFYNRLLKGQALESDATINYITGKNTPSSSYTDIGVQSAYNTYKNPGLSPGPICNPSLASIKAVLFPKKTDYYYFLHKQPSGEVLYSKTFEEHISKKQ